MNPRALRPRSRTPRVAGLILLATTLGGCEQVIGLTDPVAVIVDGRADDLPPGDASADTSDAVPAVPIDAADAPDARPPCGDLVATIRDFMISHDDFEEPVGSDFPRTGLVRPDLGPDRTPVYASSGPVPPHTAGPAAFAQWFHDVPGVNAPIRIAMPLEENASGQRAFVRPMFFPIDGQGFGNQGLPHNFHFTTEVHARFTYRAGDSFRFRGDDDFWLFINGQLVIDLGGLHPTREETANLDDLAAQLGIAVGQTYPLEIFHAERHTDGSTFEITTTLCVASG